MKKFTTLAILAIAALTTGAVNAQETVSLVIEVKGDSFDQRQQCLTALTAEVEGKIEAAEAEQAKTASTIATLKGNLATVEAGAKALTTDREKLVQAEADAREGSALHTACKSAESVYEKAVADAATAPTDDNAKAKADAQTVFLKAHAAYESAKTKASELRGALKERYKLEGDDVLAAIDAELRKLTALAADQQKQLAEAEATVTRRQLYINALQKRAEKLQTAKADLKSDELLARLERIDATLTATQAADADAAKATNAKLDRLGEVTVAGFNQTVEAVGEVKTAVVETEAEVKNGFASIHQVELKLLEAYEANKTTNELMAKDIAELLQLHKEMKADPKKAAQADQLLREAQKALEQAKAPQPSPTAAPASAPSGTVVVNPQQSCQYDQYGRRICQPQIRMAPQQGGWYGQPQRIQ